MYTGMKVVLCGQTAGWLWTCTWFTEIVCMYVCSHPHEQSFRKSNLYTRNKGYTEPELNLQAGELWFKVGNTCRFEIRVERVWKDVVKALPKGLYGRKSAEKKCSWPPRLPGKMNSFE